MLEAIAPSARERRRSRVTNAGCTSSGQMLTLFWHRLDRRRQPIGGHAMPPRLGQHVTALAKVIDESQLQYAGPRPELADRERRDRLERRDEPLQALRVEPARARADELERQRVDTRQAHELVGSHAGQTLEIRRRQVVVNVARGRRHDVEVVEQPLRRRRHGLLMRVVRKLRVEVAQRPHVILEPAEVCAPAAVAAGRNRQQRRQPARVLLEELDAQQFDVSADDPRNRQLLRHAGTAARIARYLAAELVILSARTPPACDNRVTLQLTLSPVAVSPSGCTTYSGDT